MYLNEFKQPSRVKINKLNSLLTEQFGITIKASFPKKAKLVALKENAEKALVTLRGGHKKFHLEPEYVKFLGIRDIVETMISEGMYAESPAYLSMKEMIESTIRQLMDSGYTMEEASGECMNRYRMDNRFAYDDGHVMPIVITAAKKYMEQCSMGEDLGATIENTITGVPAHNESNSLTVSEKVLRILAKEAGVELVDSSSYNIIEKKLNGFAKVSGKSRDAVVEFLNTLDEAALLSGIQMFGRKIGEANAFVDARRKAVAADEKTFTVGGKEFKVTGDTSDEKKATSESMFDDILNDMINEEVDVEQAEVVMAVRALADDVQDQIERIGRMMNEDVPAIADKMRSEMGAQAAQSFVDSVNSLLSTHLEATKGIKAGLDGAVGLMTGEEMVGGLGDTGELGSLAEPTMPEEDPEMDVNEPAAAGPADQPLGRAAV